MSEVATLQQTGLKIGDYQTTPDKTLYDTSGPKCHICGKPALKGPIEQRCTCGPTPTVPGEGLLGGGQRAPERQADALELIAGYMGEIRSLLKEIVGNSKSVAFPVPELPVTLLSSPDLPPTPAPVDVAKSEAKKAETLEKLKGVK